MHMRATIKGDPLLAKIAIPAETWQAIGHHLVNRIVSRTMLRHQDVNGAPFHAYSEGYKIAKGKAGVPGGGPVNLIGIGGGQHMMGRIVVAEVNATMNPRLSIGFADTDKATLALYHNQEGAGKGRVIREFFGLNREDEDYALMLLKHKLLGQPLPVVAKPTIPMSGIGMLKSFKRRAAGRAKPYKAKAGYKASTPYKAKRYRARKPYSPG